MKVKKKETIEVDKAETKFGEVREWNNEMGLSIEQKAGLKITLMDDRLIITIPVLRPGHDHDDICRIIINGLRFVCPEGYMTKHTEPEEPTIEFESNGYIPKFINPDKLRWRLIYDLEDITGKQYGHAIDNLVVHSYPIESTCDKCLTVLGRQETLDRFYKLIRFKEESRTHGKMP